MLKAFVVLNFNATPDARKRKARPLRSLLYTHQCEFGRLMSMGPVRSTAMREALIPSTDALDAKTELRQRGWHPYIWAHE